MRFTIMKGSASGKSWGDVDKSSIWQRLKQGLEQNAEGVREAIREVYAIVKAEITADLRQQDCWGPHHEVSEDGTVTLNRGGLFAAAAALAGARSEPDLSPAQIASAKTHLRGHYRELELAVPDALGEKAGELSAFSAAISSEVAVADIPLAPGIDLAALKAGDSDPLEVVVEIPSGRSRRGWNYTVRALSQIVEKVAKESATGFLGHQKPEDVEHQFPMPVTHWVGALMRDGKAYIRGVVDKAAGDLKRWIRAGRVRQVSIFGFPELQTAGGETNVVGYRLLSIDWTPLDRAGMPTRVVAVGEIDIDSFDTHGGGKSMSLEQLLAELKKLGVTPKVILGEMKVGLDQVAAELDAARWNALLASQKALGEICAVVGLAEGATAEAILARVKQAREVEQKQATADHDRLVDKVIGEQVVAEAVRPLVKRMLKVAANADEAAIKTAVGEVLASEDVRKSLAAVFRDIPITPKGGDEGKGGGLRVRRVAI